MVIRKKPTPAALIRSMDAGTLASSPVLTALKGSDYTIDRVVGADRVAAWGGQVVLVDLLAGHSTTATIARMAAA